MQCKGIDLTGPEWLLARGMDGRDANDRLIPSANADSSDWPVETLREDAQFWTRLDAALAVSSLGTSLPIDVEQPVQVQLKSVSQEIDRGVFSGESLSSLYVAFAFPYGTPRIVRRNLQHLFSHRTIKHDPKQTSAVEAPIALAIEGVARRQIDLSSQAHVLLLTRAGLSLEISAATLRREGNTIHIDMTACETIAPSGSGDSLRQFFENARDHTHLIHPGLASAASRVAASHAASSELAVIDLGRHAVAVGAVRHGGLMNDQLWVGGQIQKVEIRRALPSSLGVIGTNRHGDWFWRQVVEKGCLLSREAVKADLDPCSSPAEKIAMAECPGSDHQTRRWLSQDDWPTAGLRWHGILDNSEPHPLWELTLNIGQNRNQLRGVPLPTWKIVPCEQPPADVS